MSTTRDVDSYYGRFAQNFHRTPEQFSAYLRSIGSSDRSLKRQIRGELAWQRLQRRQIEPFVTVGDDEVQAVIDRINAAARHLGISGRRDLHVRDAGDRRPGRRPMPRGSSQQLRAGASFQAYARQFSEASTAALGGDLGWVRRRAASRRARRDRPADAGRRDQRADPGAGRRLDRRGRRQAPDPRRRSARRDAEPDADVARHAGRHDRGAGARRAPSSSAPATQSMGGCGGAAGRGADARRRARRQRSGAGARSAAGAAADAAHPQRRPGDAAVRLAGADQRPRPVRPRRSARGERAQPRRRSRSRWRRSGSTAGRSAICATSGATRWSTIAEPADNPAGRRAGRSGGDRA